MGKYEANRQVRWQAQCRYDGLEVVPVSTEAVEPNNHGDRRYFRIYFYGW
jgi:hypothetical protein